MTPLAAVQRLLPPAILVLHLSALVAWLYSLTMRRAHPTSGSSTPWPDRARRLTLAVMLVSAVFCWLVGSFAEVPRGLLLQILPSMLKLFSPESAVQRSLFGLASVRPAPADLLTNDVLDDFGYYAWVRPLFAIPYLTAAVTVVVLYLAYRSWREGWWSWRGRAHFAAVALSLAWYPWHLWSWGFIGPYRP